MGEQNDEMMGMASVCEALAAGLAGTSRRHRQEAAHRLAELARSNPQAAAGVAPALVEALKVSEAQTRWECLDALSEVAAVDPDLVFDAFDGAEESLFDESSAKLRLAAFRFLARYGALSVESSLEAWPLMEDAIQCYHGDSEYRDMLGCLRDFARGSLDDSVRDALAKRMAFDEKYARGLVRAYSREVSAILKEG